jgi:hypothetical protein
VVKFAGVGEVLDWHPGSGSNAPAKIAMKADFVRNDLAEGGLAESSLVESKGRTSICNASQYVGCIQ